MTTHLGISLNFSEEQIKTLKEELEKSTADFKFDVQIIWDNQAKTMTFEEFKERLFKERKERVSEAFREKLFEERLFSRL